MEHARILVVDDEIIIARDLEGRLTHMGYDVVGLASSGQEAIQLAGEYLPDLVLMDIVLKGDMDGIEAAAQIRKRFQVPIIYVTAYTDDRTLARAMITEPFGYIVKPFLEREVKANVEMALYKSRMDKKLRRIEHWFANAMEGVSEGIAVTDREHRVAALNPVGETITAWPKQLATGKPLGEVLRLVDLKGKEINFEHVTEGPIVCLGQDTWLIDRLGESIPVDSMTSGVRDGENNLTGTISVFRDASGRRHGAFVTLMTEVSVAIAESAGLQGMLTLCADSIARNVNGALVRIWLFNARQEMFHLGASAGAYAGKAGERNYVPMGASLLGDVATARAPFFTRDIRPEILKDNYEWAAREGMVSYAGYPLAAEDELLGVLAVHFRHHVSPIVLDALDAIVKSIAVGIQRKRVEEQLRLSQKMEAVGLLAGGIAHDFNNLLTVISGYTELLLTRGGLDETQRQFLGDIKDASERAAALTGQLLAFSRKQVIKPEVLDLNVVASSMKKLLHRVIGEDIELETHLDPQIARVFADAGQMEQVLANLVVNARDAMPHGGKVTIETKNVELDRGYALRSNDLKPGSYVLLAVSDTGQGIAAEDLPHVFDPFFTTKGAGHGTGLGLSTVYGIVKQAAGHVELYSEPGMGTAVKVYLPSTDAEPKAATTVAPRQVKRGTETVLVAEDEPGVRSLVVRVLSESGYNVLEAPSGTQGIALARSHSGPIHLLITDVVMPGMSGRELSDAVKALRPDTKVLFISGYTDDAVVRHGVLQAEMAFLQKPFSPISLTEKVYDVLHSEHTPTPTVDG